MLGAKTAIRDEGRVRLPISGTVCCRSDSARVSKAISHHATRIAFEITNFASLRCNAGPEAFNVCVSKGREPRSGSVAGDVAGDVAGLHAIRVISRRLRSILGCLDVRSSTPKSPLKPD
jgi:hypothetical protein